MKSIFGVSIVLFLAGVSLAVPTGPEAREGTATEDELIAEVFTRGDCVNSKEIEKGDNLIVHYSGTLLTNGDKFDSSLDRDEPFKFKMGEGKVIDGWEQGLTGACVGEQRTLTIPPRLAYGDDGIPPYIPPNAALKFDIIVLAINPTEEEEAKTKE